MQMLQTGENYPVGTFLVREAASAKTLGGSVKKEGHLYTLSVITTQGTPQKNPEISHYKIEGIKQTGGSFLCPNKTTVFKFTGKSKRLVPKYELLLTLNSVHMVRWRSL